MNDQLREAIHKHVVEVAARIQSLLPPEPSHPNGRIAVAHIYDVIHRVMGRKANSCRDQRYSDIMAIIDFCETHAKEAHVASQLRPLYPPEPEAASNPASLGRFLC